MRMIARAAGVSPTTVSHVLNETAGTYIAPTTRKKVLDTAAKLGYQKSLLSRSIKKSLRNLGIATTNRNILALDASAVIFDAFRQEALGRNYLTVDLPISAGVGVWTPVTTVKKMKELHQARLVDGYLIDKQHFTNDAVTALCRASIPMVLVNGEPYLSGDESVAVPSVIVDNYQAAHKAVDYLAALGHRNIVLITRPYDMVEKQFHPYQVSRLRKGFYAAKTLAALPCRKIDAVDGDPENRDFTEQAVKKLMSRTPRPTAIMVGDDALAIVAMQQLCSMGLRVPEDVSLMTCGGWASVMRLSPTPFTAMRARLVENGQLAAKLLIDMLDAKDVEKKVTALPAELIEGLTTGPVKNS